MTHPPILRADQAFLLVIDIQEAFLPHIHEMDRVIERTGIMIDAARLLDLPMIVTEQYPKGLGATVEPIHRLLQGTAAHDKTTFSCWKDDKIQDAIRTLGRRHAILTGIETHVCVSQTALDLLTAGIVPFILADAVSSRRASDHDIALRRLLHAGAVITTAEAAAMELTASSKHPKFKEISKRIK